MAKQKYKHTYGYATHTTVIYTVQDLQEAPSSVHQPSRVAWWALILTGACSERDPGAKTRYRPDFSRP